MKILSVVAATLVLTLTSCAGAVSSGYGQGGRSADGRSYTDSRTDNTLTARIITLLVQDRDIPAMGITVETRSKVVTLTGEVPNRAVALRAEKLAASVTGVLAVINQLRVRP